MSLFGSYWDQAQLSAQTRASAYQQQLAAAEQFAEYVNAISHPKAAQQGWTDKLEAEDADFEEIVSKSLPSPK